jgi:hypothetical protein
MLKAPSELADTLASESDPRAVERILQGWVERVMERFYQCHRFAKAMGTAAVRGRVNVQVELRWLKARVAALERAQAMRRPRPTREAAPRPDDAIVAHREKLWARYLELEMRFGHGRVKLTKLAFAIRHRLNPDEFCRWFSATDRRGIPEGSGPDLRFRKALTDAIAELESRAKASDQSVGSHSHGRIAASQFSAARPQ